MIRHSGTVKSTTLQFLTLACILICWKFYKLDFRSCPVSPHPPDFINLSLLFILLRFIRGG